jgi:two-component system NarL family sensor kinase
MPFEDSVIANISLPELDHYIRLIWLFVFIITFLIIFLCYLFLAKRRAEQKELSNLTFSHLVIEGMETERRRISRELHDTILPLVSDTAVSDRIREICTVLMPPDFTRLSLRYSFEELCEKFTGKSGIKCVCSIGEELDFSQLTAVNQLHLYRMVQEALNNIEKHSQAQSAALVARTFSRGSSVNWLICVSDDGVGIKAGCGEGLGMQSIRQRAGILGAKIDFISEAGNGLLVRIEIPAPNKHRSI